MKIAYIGSGNSVTVTFLDSVKSYTITSDNPNWQNVIDKLNSGDYEGLEDLLSVKKKIVNYTNGSTITVDDGGVKYKDKYIDNYLTQKIVEFMNSDLPVKPLVNFFEKVMKNPSRRAVSELYKFLEHGNMPILDNGNFIGYKSVSPDYKDWYTRKFDNSIGQTLEMERNEVCDDPTEGCSYGFHVGSLSYATDFNGGSNKVVLVEVDPFDVVSVPHDCNHQKLRTAKYTVIGEFEVPLNSNYDDRYADDDNEDEDNDDRIAIIAEIDERVDFLKNLLRTANDTSEIREILEELEELEEEREQLL